MGLEKDILVFKDEENPERMFHVEVTEDGKHIFLYILKDSSRVSGANYLYRDLIILLSASLAKSSVASRI